MADLSGERLGPFEVRQLIGTGGFATVYLAHDPRLGADVALKILAENHSLDPAIRERFLGEANALRRVDSTGVIRIFDIRETPDARPYLVLEHADRGDLANRRRIRAANGWTPSRADIALVIESLAEALDAIHAENLVHRDITPGNVLLRSGRRSTQRPGVSLVEPDERLLVSDMGMVKDLSAGSGFTIGGGTAGFWAPEQQQPLATVDRRTDIYSASALVVWLISDLTVTTAPDWPSQLRAEGWPVAMVAELERGMSFDPDERHQSIREWEAALVASLHAGPAPSTSLVAEPAPTTGLVAEHPKRAASLGPVLLGALGLVAAALAVFVLTRGSGGGSGGDNAQTSVAAPPAIATAAPSIGETATLPATEPAAEPATQPSTQPSTEPATVTTQPAVARSVDTWALGIHRTGTQMVVRQVDFADDATTLTIDVINGRDFSTRFRADDNGNTRLVDSQGNRLELLDSMTLDLDHGETASFDLRFEPIAAVDPTAAGTESPLDSLTLEFNQRDDIDSSLEAGTPGFIIPIPVDDDSAAPPLPGPTFVDDADAHPTSMTVRVHGVAFTERSISVDFSAINGSGRQRDVTTGHESSYLEDDLGNQYWLKFEGSNRAVRVGEGRQARGTLVFAGRVDPVAETLRLVLNHEASPTDAATSTPRFDLGPWPITGTATTAIAPIEPVPGGTAEHPNGATVRLDRISFDPTVTLVDAAVVNEYRLQVWVNSCCDVTHLVDDLGNRYQMANDASDDRVVVPSGATQSGVLAFLGSIDADASTIRLVLNARDEGGLTDPDTSNPEFSFGPWPLERTTVDDTAGFTPGTDGPWTVWTDERAPVSEFG